jgi:hypothetical protein
VRAGIFFAFPPTVVLTARSAFAKKLPARTNSIMKYPADKFSIVQFNGFIKEKAR